MSYDIQAIFSVIRLTISFLFVFGFVTPLFFEHAGNKRGIDRIVFSWVGLGGLIIIGTFMLVNLHIYDFISILFCLLMLPLLVHFFKRKWEGSTVTDIFNRGENRIVANHVLFIEKVKNLNWADFKQRIFKKPPINPENPYSIAAVGIGILASVLRIIPSIQNSAPFSRVWYFELDAVKGLSLQEYFSGYPTPKGMHSIINFFSTITQVSPEMILHIIGALISFFLAVIIFWVMRDLTKRRHQSAALLSALIYAVFPTLFLPVSMELESELTSLSFSLCFALPTMLFFLRNIRSGGKTPWFYIFMGIVATGLTNVFVLLMVLLPFMLVGILSIPKKYFFKRFGKITLYLISIYVLTLAPYIIYCLASGLSVGTFFQDQLFNTQVFSFTTDLIIPIEELSLIYFYAGIILFAGFLIRLFVQQKKRIGDEMVFLMLFVCISYLYTPFFDYQYVYIDPDQLNSFYGMLICIFFGLSMCSIFIFLEWIIKPVEKITPYVMPIITLGVVVFLFAYQGGLRKSSKLPKTEPNGFFNAYYNIINERIPYTYATVGPELDRELAKNRHFFMNYQFFLNNYGVIDSLYQQYLMVPDDQRPEVQEVPPASIFLFVEKPPYGSIQQGILYDAQNTMRDIEQWLVTFRQLEGRKVRVYYETEEAIVYEIVNRDDESTIGGVLRNIYPTEEGRAARLFK
ncbi:MAG: hypothetical protein JJ953_10310 [Gracilimonas sp.]|uniref:hypothetical protein n=1 Tax=Gracilimonas TaxID=649462 RepID=UPI001B023AE2|nr:hypothetical protein [Gracilimonas sp.]MBO6586487.1 hypothetical protein [Gracilimonas sp.]MBO6615144.1 hypothetical protein [Gracilimonas sp.]